jgi:hypothetical protein
MEWEEVRCRRGGIPGGTSTILDGDCNVVFTADSLEPRFPKVHRALRSISGEPGVSLRITPGRLDV